MTATEIIQKLEQYRLDLIDITQRFTSFGDIPRIRPGDGSKYFTLVITIMDLLNDTIGENQYSTLIKKLYNESITNNDPQLPMPQDIKAIVAVIDAAIARLNNNPDFYIKKNELPNQREIPTTLYSKIHCFCSKHGPVIVLIGVIATIAFGLPGLLTYFDSETQSQQKPTKPSKNEINNRVADKANNGVHKQLTSAHR